MTSTSGGLDNDSCHPQNTYYAAVAVALPRFEPSDCGGVVGAESTVVLRRFTFVPEVEVEL